MPIALGVFAVLVLVVLVVVGFVIGQYNKLIRMRNQVDQSWANVETELQRRYDLIPNLVNTVKGYATHEKELLEEVTRLRQDAMANTGSPGSQARTEGPLNAALGNLMVRLEAYPDLKANTNFLQLQQDLANTEDRIQQTRGAYNGAVRQYNDASQQFPANIIAGMFSFGPKEFFEIDNEAVREVPKVAF